MTKFDLKELGIALTGVVGHEMIASSSNQPKGLITMINLIIAFLVSASPVQVDHTPPCIFAEAAGPRCVWDARHMGNGEGRSFINLGDETVKYITHHRAHRLMTTNR